MTVMMMMMMKVYVTMAADALHAVTQTSEDAELIIQQCWQQGRERGIVGKQEGSRRAEREAEQGGGIRRGKEKRRRERGVSVGRR